MLPHFTFFKLSLSKYYLMALPSSPPNHNTISTPLTHDSVDSPHPHFRSHMLGDGPPSQQRALPSQQRCTPLSRAHSVPDNSNATESQYQQQQRGSPHGVTTELHTLNSQLVSAAPSPSSADSAAISSRVHYPAEEFLGLQSTIPTLGAHTQDRR
jgi:hypothetical protein